jgi:hypothetical protein
VSGLQIGDTSALWLSDLTFGKDINKEAAEDNLSILLTKVALASSTVCVEVAAASFLKLREKQSRNKHPQKTDERKARTTKIIALDRIDASFRPYDSGHLLGHLHLHKCHL